MVFDLLGELGWPAGRVLDLGGLDAARAMEGHLPLWRDSTGTSATRDSTWRS